MLWPIWFIQEQLANHPSKEGDQDKQVQDMELPYKGREQKKDWPSVPYRDIRDQP